jgi:hypothetical protein
MADLLLGVRWVVLAIPVYDKHVAMSAFGCIRPQPIVAEVVCQRAPSRQFICSFRVSLSVAESVVGYKRRVRRGRGSTGKPTFTLTWAKICEDAMILNWAIILDYGEAGIGDGETEVRGGGR